jgi:glucose/arabinose dehydrogenase
LVGHKISLAITAAIALTAGALAAAAPAAADPTVPLPLLVNFQAQTTVTPSGYVGDYGQPYDSTRGYGWVDSAGAPLSLVGNGRDRGVLSDKRLDTFVHMQLPAVAAGVHTQGAWKASVPNGSYVVTVAVGDPSYFDSHHVVHVEGTTAIDFTPTSAQPNQTNSVTVNVTDGFVDVDATGGTNTKLDYVQVQAATSGSPTVVAVLPANGATSVPLDSAVTVQLSNGVDPSTANANGVHLLDAANTMVDGHYNTDGAYSNVTFVPTAKLVANAVYTIKVTAALKDPQANSYQPFTSTFTTGTTVAQQPAPVTFTRSTFDAGDGTVGTNNTAGPTALALGPDGRLYVAFGTGDILAYALDANGNKSGTPVDIAAFKFQRTISGIRFDPASTASNLTLWVSNGQFGCDLGATGTACNDFTGMVSKLSGTSAANLVRTDVVTGLPRSVGNHMNNGIDFGPDGAMYLGQGANSGYGAPDAIWGNRSEDPLSAAILRIDYKTITTFPYSVDTSLGYNPQASGAKVTTYATGTRNPFSVLWHSNGKLYAPVNESANGNSPADPAGGAPALSGLPAFNDYFTQVVQGKFYGHPNPTRAEYRLNGANPTSGADPFEVSQYPVGTSANANWRKPDLDLGLHRSPDGSVEFKSNVFGGVLKGQVLVTEYSQGKDIIAIQLDASGNAVSRTVVMSGFNNPLPITADPVSGRVYVGEYGRDPDGAGGLIDVLVPQASTAVAKVNFQAQTTATPTGYVGDFGSAFDTTRGYGWEDLSGAPLSLVGNGRERTLASDKRLDTLIHMQAPAGGAVTTPGRWELVVPNGTYSVTIGVGDPGYFDSRDVLNAEGATIVDFTPTSATRQTIVTAGVTVADGRLTIDPVGGTNTKIDYIDVNTAGGPPPPPPPPSAVKVTSPDDVLGLLSRLVFSTVASEVRPGKNLTLTNTGSSAVQVTNLTISGADANQFVVDPAQLRSFSIPAGGSANVLIDFRPVTAKVVDNSASLTIATNSAGGTNFTVALAGLNALDYEGASEPSAQEIFNVLGYTASNAGVTNTQAKNYISNVRTPAGDEIVSPYWKRADSTAPMQLIPVAQYSGRHTYASGPIDWFAKGTPGTRNALFTLPGGSDASGGQNQRLLPSITPGGTTSFATASVFGVHDEYGDFSDDALASAALHDFRFYPAKGADGLQIPNTWLVADDVGQDASASSGKNWDFQDYVFLLRNAQPELTAAAVPGDPSLNLDFSAAKTGTITDKSGLGTGFTSVQANTAGTQYVPAQLTLDTASGALKILSTAGSNTNGVNNQQNALQLGFDGTRQKFQAQSRLIGPFTGINLGSDQQAIFVGPDQDNYFKLEVECQGDGKQHLTIWYEKNGVGSILTSVLLSNPSAATVDLFITGDPAAGTLQAAYRVNSNNAADVITFGAATVVPDVMRWFSRQSRAGIMANNSNGGTPFTSSFDTFSVIGL